MSPRRLFTAFWVWIAALAVAYYVFPSQKLPIWAAIGLSSTAAVIVGAVYNRPRRVLPWVLMALGLLALTIGDVTYLVLIQDFGQVNPFPSVNDAIYLATYPLLTIGLLLLPRSSTGRDRGAIIDVLVLTAGLGLLAWIFLVSPFLKDQTRSATEQLASIAYPLFDILFLAAAARLLIEVRRTVSVGLMAVGGISLLATDVLYGLSQLNRTWHGTGSPIDVGWIVFYATWAAAALHPSMRQLTEPRVIRDSGGVTPVRMAVLTLSALVAPTVLLIESARGSDVDAIPIAVLSAVVFLLVLLRLAGVVRNYRQATDQERSLRESGGALVFATDVDTVRSVVTAAVGRLFPPGEHYMVSLPLKDDTLQDETVDRAVRESFVRHPLPARFIRTDAILAESLRSMRRHEIAFVVPLVVSDRAVGEPLIGTLVVAADDQRLGVLQGTFEALAAQAALAIERITLNAEVARRNSEQYFRTLVQSTADVILIMGADDTVRYASPSATPMFGTSTLTGRRVPELVVEDQRRRAELALARVRRGEEPGSGYWSVPRPDASTADVEVSVRDLRDEPTVGGIVFTIRDVTEQLRLERELTHLAFHDQLTRLPNRVRFGDEVQRAVARSRPAEEIIGVLFIDVDDFKVVNDTMGHDTGDQLIEEVARRLSTVVGDRNMAARLGGDEFAVLVEHARSPADVEDVATRIVNGLAEPVVIEGSLLSASASIGVATTVDATAKGDLLRQADLALYVAKGSGKGRWRRYQSALHTAMVKRLQLRSALDRAVADGDFALVYQPIVALTDGWPAGCEALLRWVDPERGLIPPAEFIDMAEDSGLIVPIGNWLLERAMADAVSWSADGVAPYLSVNVSVRQFRSPGLIAKIQQELARSGLPPDRLILEITESLLLRDDERVWTDLARLRDLGIRVAIDDFGTGYSSLSYLRQVPVDILKIDKSFIDTMSSSTQQRSLVETIVRLSKTLGLDVIAEGIERQQDRDLLVDMDCSYGQGYLFGRPMDNDDLHRWLRSHVGQSA